MPLSPALPLLDAPAGTETLGGFIDSVANRFGPREAVAVYDPLRGGMRIAWTYDELRRQSRDVAKALIAAGVGKGERVGILLGNRPEFVAALFGATMAGATVVTLSTFATRDELSELLRLSDISVLFTQRAIARRSLEEDLAAVAPTLPSAEFPFLRRIVILAGTRDTEDWDAFLAAGRAVEASLLAARAARVNGNDEAVIIYTSGTTSQPKGVIHLQSTLTRQFHWQAQIYGRHPNTRIASPFPLFWSAGLVSVLGSTLAVGGLYVADEVFESGAALALIARERIDEWYGFPTHTAALAEHPGWPDTDLSSMTRVQGNNEFDSHPRRRAMATLSSTSRKNQ